MKRKLVLNRESIRVLTNLAKVIGGAPDDAQTLTCTLGSVCSGNCNPSDRCPVPSVRNSPEC